MESAKNVFISWEFPQELKIAFDVEEIRWGTDGISFICISTAKDEHRRIRFRIRWDGGSLIAYHVTDETYRADCWGLDFEKDGRLYVAESSAYIDMLKQKSPLFPEQVFHFLIVGTDTIIDVLAKDPPYVTLLEINS